MLFAIYNRPMSGRELFEDLERRGWPVVEEWTAANQAESLHLEFKKKETPTTSKLEDPDKDYLAKTLSGFSNVEGGLLVVGMNTKSVNGGADKLDAPIPIAGIDDFAGRVERNIATYTTPTIAGVMVRAIKEPGKHCGVLAIYVPASDGGPHRASNASATINDRYFMRTAASTVNMPHALLEDRFGRRPPPRLRLGARLDGSVHLTLDLRLHNHGRGTARQVALRLEGLDDAMRWRDELSLAKGWSILWDSNGAIDRVIYRAPSDWVLYPGMSLPVARLTAQNESQRMHQRELTGTTYAVDARPVDFAEVLIVGQEALLPTGD